MNNEARLTTLSTVRCNVPGCEGSGFFNQGNVHLCKKHNDERVEEAFRKKMVDSYTQSMYTAAVNGMVSNTDSANMNEYTLKGQFRIIKHLARTAAEVLFEKETK
jgi:hypothetical protein